MGAVLGLVLKLWEHFDLVKYYYKNLEFLGKGI
jgi:hypothetical protein